MKDIIEKNKSFKELKEFRDKMADSIIEIEKTIAEWQADNEQAKQIVRSLDETLQGLKNASVMSATRDNIRRTGDAHPKQLVEFLKDNAPNKFPVRAIKNKLIAQGIDFNSPNPHALISKALLRLADKNLVCFEKKGNRHFFWFRADSSDE